MDHVLPDPAEDRLRSARRRAEVAGKSVTAALEGTPLAPVTPLPIGWRDAEVARDLFERLSPKALAEKWRTLQADLREAAVVVGRWREMDGDGDPMVVRGMAATARFEGDEVAAASYDAVADALDLVADGRALGDRLVSTSREITARVGAEIGPGSEVRLEFDPARSLPQVEVIEQVIRAATGVEIHEALHAKWQASLPATPDMTSLAVTDTPAARPSESFAL